MSPQQLRRRISSPDSHGLLQAPEVLLGRDYDIKSDVYSFGILLWEMYTRESMSFMSCAFRAVADH